MVRFLDSQSYLLLGFIRCSYLRDLSVVAKTTAAAAS